MNAPTAQPVTPPLTLSITVWPDGSKPPQVTLPTPNLDLALQMLFGAHQLLLKAAAQKGQQGPVQPALIIPARNGHTPNLRTGA